MQISKLTSKQSQYPVLLHQIAAPPRRLFVLGQIPTTPMIAIVGSRIPTQYGKQITYQLAGELSRAGIAIVSGLAMGVDAIAHQATLEAGGPTVAVLAGGLDRIYPSSNRGLASKIIDNGALLSEYPAGTPPLRHHFVARNRIVTGLCLAVIVTEANASSGALLSANFALQQNRQVMAVPGNITSPRSAGPNNLIKAGAMPITCAEDVLSALNFDSAASQPIKANSREEASVLELLAEGVNSSQELIERSGLTASQFANIISLMEITGKVRNLGAGQWVSR